VLKLIVLILKLSYQSEDKVHVADCVRQGFSIQI